MTRSENVRNSFAAKLNIPKVKKIKKLLKEKNFTQGKIAKMFDIGAVAISRIKLGIRWIDV